LYLRLSQPRISSSSSSGDITPGSSSAMTTEPATNPWN
jgi:hypothetical protein